MAKKSKAPTTFTLTSSTTTGKPARKRSESAIQLPPIRIISVAFTIFLRTTPTKLRNAVQKGKVTGHLKDVVAVLKNLHKPMEHGYDVFRQLQRGFYIVASRFDLDGDDLFALVFDLYRESPHEYLSDGRWHPCCGPINRLHHILRNRRSTAIKPSMLKALEKIAGEQILL